MGISNKPSRGRDSPSSQFLQLSLEGEGAMRSSGGTVCQAEGTASAKALRLGSVL